MHVYTPQTATKENTGEASRRLQIKRLFYLSALFIIIASSICFVVGTGRNFTNLRQALRSKRRPPRREVDERSREGEVASSGANLANASKLRSSNNMNVKKYRTEPGGRSIEMILSNLEGIPSNDGKIVIETHPSWSPLGAERLHELVERSFYDENRFFRAIPHFIVQFGINGDPEVQAEWRGKRAIKDDPVVQSNERGTVVFATSGKDTRTTQLYINLKNNKYLDKEGFTPVGKVVEGMDVVEKVYMGYGGDKESGAKQGRIQREGNSYLKKEFPLMSFVKEAYFMD